MKALRTVPVVLDVAERVKRNGAEGAWIIDFTNPVGIVTRALARRRSQSDRPLQRGDRLRTTVRASARRSGRGRRDRAGWPQSSVVDSFCERHDGTERLPEILDRFGHELAERLIFPLTHSHTGSHSLVLPALLLLSSRKPWRR